MSEVSLLVILDGFGYREEATDNAIAQAHTPNWDALWATRPRTLISGSGEDVGLPAGQMGNSEVGHMILGAGRVLHQDFSRINQAIENGDFARNSEINTTLNAVSDSKGALHILGLLSPGGVHSHEQQIFALIRHAAACGLNNVYLHAFLDGRDTPPRSARASLDQAQALFDELTCGSIVSVTGRYFAMDRDRRWDRQERAYNAITRGEAPFHAESAVAALDAAYARGEDDEFVQPTAIHPNSQRPIVMTADDAAILMNFRADRARQLTRAMTEPGFDGFQRRSFTPLQRVTTLTRYADDIDLPCAFPPATPKNTLGEYLATLERPQLRIAETEKYAHVTFFFSGGREEPFAQEHRILIPSPDVATYDLQPQMSAAAVTKELVAAIHSGDYDTIICNYANGDMVGHSGNLAAAIKAVETLDTCIAQLVEAISAVNGQMLITADHGNVEKMHDTEHDQAHTAHTENPVPLVYVGAQTFEFADQGTLADVAPTLLTLKKLPVPDEMSGRSLILRDIQQSV
ncbi:MAG: phosphoglycerate mutase (2,3-diphosphoglycerate-independent) [Gammaproteobacteria bacterium]|nr:phosphoglycerate mutase (2,3-diphosphoglycerate-independent) [Gammaproteobacteria bacterium]